MGKPGLQNSGRSRHVVVVRRWSLAQVWLQFENNFELCSLSQVIDCTLSQNCQFYGKFKTGEIHVNKKSSTFNFFFSFPNFKSSQKRMSNQSSATCWFPYPRLPFQSVIFWQSPFPFTNTVCFIDFDKGNKIIIFESILAFL